MSGGLLDFLWDADHQTLEEAFDGAVRRERHIFKNYWKGRHFYVCSRCGISIESWPKGASEGTTYYRFCKSSWAPRQTPKGWYASVPGTWRDDAEEYGRQHYYTITDMLKPVLEPPRRWRPLRLSASIAHRIAVDRAD